MGQNIKNRGIYYTNSTCLGSHLNVLYKKKNINLNIIIDKLYNLRLGEIFLEKNDRTFPGDTMF